MKKKTILHRIIISCIFFSLSIFMTNCISTKNSTGKASKNLYETFFVGDEGTQYYIKPLLFSNNNEELLVDITFRYKTEIKDSATINISFITNTLIKDIDSMFFSNNSIKVPLIKQRKLFSERYKKGFKLRFSFSILLADLNKLFQDNQWKITYYYNSTSGNFTPNKKTSKKLDLLAYVIFELF